VTNGSLPNTRLLQASDGNFYGSTQNGGTNGDAGTIFTMTPQGAITSLYSFSGKGATVGPISDLVQAANGSFYGCALNGGAYSNGYIFRFTIPSAILPKIQMGIQPGNIHTLSWIPLPMRSYQVQTTSNLNLTGWQNLGAPIRATNSILTTPVATNSTSYLLYRVALLPP
jgi:uncharacterized repeat protein (TIGR03803 family)